MAGYATRLRNAQLDAITTDVGNAGLLQAYNGTKPSTGGAATTKLAEWTLGSPFAPGAAAAVLSPTLPSDTTGITNGMVTWLRITRSDSTFVMDIPVSQVTLNTNQITTGLPCKVLGFSITAGNA